jgi:phosphatidylglycerol:prolipoprotein diacylglycerol transferase
MLPLLASIGWPVLDRFRFGDAFAISPHGVFIVIGFLTGAWLLTRLAPRHGITDEHISSIIFWCLIGALIGSRFFYVLAHFGDYSSLADMLAVWRGGISLLGGIAGAILINVPRLRRYRYRFFQVTDPAAVALALGIAVGRIGDLIIGDHLGKPTSWLLAWRYSGGTLAPPFDRPCSVGSPDLCASLPGAQLLRIGRAGATLLDANGQTIASGVGVHQTALYDMILAALLFGLLWYLHQRPRREGVLTLTFGLCYGVFRLLEDSLRVDKRFGPFTGSQWTALTVAIVALGLLIWFAITKRPGPTTPGRVGTADTGRSITASADGHGSAATRAPGAGG